MLSTIPAQVSFVLPSLNEGTVIESSLRSLDEWFGDIPAEVIVIDDGSSDDTADRAMAYARTHPHVFVRRLDRNQGKGAAIAAAIPHVTGSRIVIVDADLAYDSESIRAAIRGLDGADIVVGNRRHEASRYSVPVRLFGFLYRRHVVGLAFNAFVRLMLPLDSRDTQCGLKAFRRETLAEVARSLTSRGFAFDIEVLLIARARGFRVAQVPVRVTYESSKTSIKLVRNGAAMAWEVVRMAVRQARGCYRVKGPQ